MNQLVIEIFSEEVPARMLTQARLDYQSLWQRFLADYGICFDAVTVVSDLRRMVVCVDGISLESKNITEKRRGPKVGAPAAAMSGFLKSVGLIESDLLQENGYWVAKMEIPGTKVEKLLPEIFDKVCHAMPWPKSMRWPQANLAWIRPVRNIAMVLNGKTISTESSAFGIKTNNYGFGHRFLHPEMVAITTFSQYKKDLEKAHVLLDDENRKAQIMFAIDNLCKNHQLNPLPDESLLEEVTGLVEYPFVGLGSIDKKFMELPKEVITTCMRVHQKYFAVVDSFEKLQPHFVFVANSPVNADHMTPGFERVLRARLMDALFFYEQDQKTPFESRFKLLNNVTFHQKLGSVADKVKRLEFLSTSKQGKQAAKFSKLDLTTLMVNEFPELQGIMGAIYAKKYNIAEDICHAIAKHYSPQGPEDEVPLADLSWELALNDRLDSLVGLLGSGIKPSGSKDPLGIRRAAIGILRLMLAKGSFELLPLVEKSLEAYKNQSTALLGNTIELVQQFITERLTVYLKNEMPATCVYAVLNEPLNNIWLTVERARVLHDLLSQDEGKILLAAYKRVSGILKGYKADTVKPDLLVADEEKALYQYFITVTAEVKESLKNYEFIEAMFALGKLKEPIDLFFDNVRVNDDDQNIQNNRKNLLAMYQETLHTFADFSKIEG